jgi:hypothetical protein
MDPADRACSPTFKDVKHRAWASQLENQYKLAPVIYQTLLVMFCDKNAGQVESSVSECRFSDPIGRYKAIG